MPSHSDPSPGPPSGHAAYCFAEVARLTGLPAGVVRAWYLEPRGRAAAKLHSDHPRIAGDLAVSFLNLVEAPVVRALRDAGVPVRDIRAACRNLAQPGRLSPAGTDHPFAHRHTQDALAAKFPAAAAHAAFARQLAFDPDTRLATRWRPAPGVLIDPDIARGKPALAGTATCTELIAREFEANHGRAERVADLYDLTPDQVRAAAAFEANPAGGPA